VRTSVIIPAYNSEKTIGQCLEALINQTAGRSDYEIIVVDDGSTDRTAELIGKYTGIKLIKQSNAGPAAARNNGAKAAQGDIILFTDADCIPEPDWIEQMLIPFEKERDLCGAKGIYKTRQREMAARFVQIEYQDKYDHLKKPKYIDFVDTYSAGFKRDVFLRFQGYDTSFPVACAEDVELSFRMSNAGLKMVFNPQAVVYHTHPNNWISYFKKKYKFAYWRMVAVKKNPNKMIKDAHTPQLMKLQTLLAPMLTLSLIIWLLNKAFYFLPAGSLILFLLSTIPFAVKAAKRDFIIGIISPLVLLGRSLFQFAGIAGGLIKAITLKK